MAMRTERNREQGGLWIPAFTLGVAFCANAWAAEGGGSGYLQGTYGDFGMAIRHAPGFQIRDEVIYYDAGIGPRPLGGQLDAGADPQVWLNLAKFTWTSDGNVFGGKFGVQLSLPYEFEVDVNQRPGGPGFGNFRAPKSTGMGDPVFTPEISWGAGPHYATFGVGIVTDWGDYDADRIYNPGRNNWAFDPAFSYTYLGSSGVEFSTTGGMMMNQENRQSNYRTGNELHLDALFGKHFGEHFAFGIAGYWYNQLNDDKGNIPAPLDPGYQSSGTGFGPVIMFGSRHFSVVGKWLHDVTATNRLDGDLYMVSFVARFYQEAPPPAPAAPPVARVEPPPPPPPPPQDSDGDGVVDAADLCPATPRGERVDANGCACDVTVQLHFKTASAEITEVDAIALSSLAEQLRNVPALAGEIGGHTDSQGSDAYNVELSRRRALAVRDYLTARGLPTAQLAVAGYGESQPIADNTTPEGRAQNRRVVIRRTSCESK